MKVGINDGCANGGMMDSLSIDEFTEEDETDGWTPAYTVEVTEAEWAAWTAHLKEHKKWERFWDKRMLEEEARSRPKLVKAT